MILGKRSVFIFITLLLLMFLARTHAEEEALGIPIIRRPIQEYLSIVEHTCIKHIRANELKEARASLRVMNDICADKKVGFSMLKEHVAEFERKLSEARRAKEEHLRSGSTELWLCLPAGKKTTQQQKDFYEKVGKPVSDVLRSLGVHPDMVSLVLAQIAHETGWGRFAMGNNLFNIKGEYNGQSNVVHTHEFDKNGNKIMVDDKFRSYPGTRESVDDYLSVLRGRWNEAYQQLFLKQPSVDKFISGLKVGQQGGYATDPLYEGKLKSVFERVQEELTLFSDLIYVRCL